MPLSRRNFIQNAVLGISAAGLSTAPALAKNISSSTAHIISKTSGHGPANLFISSVWTDWRLQQKM